MEYRPDIDGLRALAVLPVVIFHYDSNYFPNGYLGVDVFFVISGYLITNGILKTIERGNWSFLNFYRRRTRRLIPAALFWLFFSLVFAVILFSPYELRQFSKSLFSAILSLSNFYYMNNGSYFGPILEVDPLIHTWSLAVEEQFYIIWPLVLFLISSKGKKTILFIFSLIFFLSLFIFVLGNYTNESKVFFFSPARIWELVLGGIASLFVMKSWVSLNSGRFLGISAIIFLYLAGFLFPNIPYHFLVIAVAFSTFCYFLSTKKSDPVSEIMSIRPFVFIGLISYSMYLCHQPIFAFFRLTKWGESNFVSFVMLLGLILLFSWVSRRYLEVKFIGEREKKT